MDRASSLERMVFMCDNCLAMMMSPDETSHIDGGKLLIQCFSSCLHSFRLTLNESTKKMICAKGDGQNKRR